MAQNLDISVLVSQLPHLQQLQNAQQVHPEVAQAHFGKEALERQIRERRKIPSTDKSETDIKIRPDERQERDQPRQARQEGKRGQKDGDKAEADPAEPGQIIDLSV